MKLLVLTFFSLLWISPSFSQLKEGYFKFDIQVKSIDTSKQVQQMMRMYRNSTMELFFDLDHARIDFVLGKFGQMSTRLNYKDDVGLSMSNSIQGKYATTGSVEAISNDQKDENIVTRVVPFEEYKTILGFKCKKYVVDEGEGNRATYWCTEEIALDDRLKNIINDVLPAFPLAFSSTQNGLKMYYQAVDFREKVENPKITFDTSVPKGFKAVEK